MNDRETIEKLITQQQRISDRNFRNYQESGESRYYRAHQKAEDIIGICNLALGGADEHSRYINMRVNLCQIGTEAMRLLHDNEFLNDPHHTAQLLRNIKAIAKSEGVKDPYDER